MNIGSLGGQSLSSLYASVYKKLDADSSGGVSVDELGQGMSSGTRETKDVTKLFSAMDTDADGSLTSTEVTSYFQSNLSLDTLTGAQGAGRGGPPKGPPLSGGPGGGQPPSLSDIDSDEDGSISKTEMQAYGSNTMGDEDATKADAIFSAMDTDQDGTVSADEKAAFDKQMAAKASDRGGNGPRGAGGPPSGPPPSEVGSNSTSSETTSASADAVQQLTAQWLQSLYASLSSGASSLTESQAISASTVSVTA